MVDALRRLAGGLTLQGRASRYHARERRLSRVGLPDLHRTHAYAIPTASISDGLDLAVDPSLPCTFATSIEVTAATPVGLIFEIGDGTTAIAAWLDDTDLSFYAGTGTGADRALATYTVAGGIPDGLKLDLIFAVIPGDGRVRMWGAGAELARDAAAGGELPNGWAANSAGAFAAAAQGALPADVTQTGAPSNFACTQPLSVYAHQVPQHFV